jgi:hypothetical protein
MFMFIDFGKGLRRPLAQGRKKFSKCIREVELFMSSFDLAFCKLDRGRHVPLGRPPYIELHSPTSVPRLFQCCKDNFKTSQPRGSTSPVGCV